MSAATPSTAAGSIDDLCVRYENESVHTEHVAALALKLFDETRKSLGIPAKDRPLLAAACRLHDVGYSVTPRHHAEAGADIILREGLRGFDPMELRQIAAAILFHSGKWESSLDHPVFQQAADPDRVMRLGAFLRLADGLDYGHIQDASIVRVQTAPRSIQVAVVSPWSAVNLDAANRKADLWCARFPLTIRIVPASKRAAFPAALIEPGMHPVEAARRLLWLQFRIVLTNVDGALEGKTSEPLHDIRVALRRFHAVLQTFDKPLSKTSAPQVDRAWKRSNSLLGPPRDVDVWVDFLTGEEVQKRLADNRRWSGFIRHQRTLRELQAPTVRRILSGAAFCAFRLKVGRLLRTELPRLIGVEPRRTLGKLARTRLRKALRRAFKLAHLRRSTSSDDLHQLRIALRRTRYLGEFFSPVLGPPIDKLTRRIHAVEQALGRIHDVDVGLRRILREGPAPPRLLVAHLRQRRANHVGKMEKAWGKLERSSLQRIVRRRLDL